MMASGKSAKRSRAGSSIVVSRQQGLPWLQRLGRLQVSGPYFDLAGQERYAHAAIVSPNVEARPDRPNPCGAGINDKRARWIVSYVEQSLTTRQLQPSQLGVDTDPQPGRGVERHTRAVGQRYRPALADRCDVDGPAVGEPDHDPGQQ